MNYLFLKNIVMTLTQNFVCPHCHSGTPKDEALEVRHISQSEVEIVFSCPACREQSLLKAETSQINPQFLATEIGQKFAREIMKKGSAVVPSMKKQWIPTEELQKVQEKLQHNITVQELIDENN